MSLILSLFEVAFITTIWLSGFYVGIARQKRNNYVRNLELEKQRLENKVKAGEKDES